LIGPHNPDRYILGEALQTDTTGVDRYALAKRSMVAELIPDEPLYEMAIAVN
jgi:hypothetical protein